ncbi:MAG: hypothetical protein ABH814_00900 [bacterium]
MNFSQIPPFSKEFKRYAKKYRALNKDLGNFKKVVAFSPCGTGKHFNIITVGEGKVIVKARLFCRSLKGSSLRIIYAYCKKEETIEFLELYFKGDKSNEDKTRIGNYLGNKI